MRKHIRNILYVALFLTSLGFNACTDYLDKSPHSDINPDDVYKNFTNFQGFVEHLYNHIPLISAEEYHNCWNFGEDEYWEPTEQRLVANQFDQGNYWAWETAYYSVCRIGLKRNEEIGAMNGEGKLWV